MKKKYGIESILGKKTRIRIPKLFIKYDTLKVLLPANNALSEPPFSTNITMKKGDPLEVCDVFNEATHESDVDLPIKTLISLAGTTLLIDISTPSTFSLINIAFDTSERVIERFRASIPDILHSFINFALIKKKLEGDYFLSDIYSHIKTLYGNLFSYNCRRKKPKFARALIKKVRPQRFLNTTSTTFNKKYHQKKLYHFFGKLYRFKRKKRYPLLFERIDYFYDCFEDWDETFEFFDMDQSLDIADYHHEVTLFYSLYSLCTKDIFYPKPLAVLKNRTKLLKNIESFEPVNIQRTDGDLIKSYL